MMNLNSKVLFIGQNPASKKLEGSPAFDFTASGKRLWSWIEQAGIPLGDCEFHNAFSKAGKVPNTLPEEDIKRLEEVCLKFDMIVAVGNYAKRQLSKCYFASKAPIFIAIEHPSGRNRNINEESAVQSQIERLRYSYESHIKNQSSKTGKRQVIRCG